jgi:hypothetical protein
VAKTKTSFKKGKSGNPAGRPRIPDDVKAMRSLNQVELTRILNHVVFLPMPEIKALTKSAEAPAFLVGSAKLVEKFAKYGDVFAYHALLDRLIGRTPNAPLIELPPPLRDVTAPAKRTFTEFCIAAGYPAPYPKQIEMFDFAFSSIDTRLLLGARNYGKTDYLTILGAAYRIYMDPSYTILILTKEEKRAKSIVKEISEALKKNDVVLEVDRALELKVSGLIGKDYSVEGLSIRSGLRGRHPDMIIMDDPVTEEDVSEATRKLVQRKYNEAHKLCSNILVIGQPAHAHDLYAKLRNMVKKMEVPWGTIPELDHDLEAQRLAGVDEKSIQASYYLKIISDGTAPFEKINYLDRFPIGESVAFLDPSHKGKDTSALSIVRQHFQGIAVVGFAAHRAWNHWLDDIVPKLVQFKVKRIAIECNGLGDEPVLMLRRLLAGHGIGVVGVDSTDNKHACIMSAGAYAHLIHLSKESDRAYTDQVVQYEYGAEPDDAPDSLARCLKWIGLIRGEAGMRGFATLDNPNHRGKTNTWLTPLSLVRSLGDFDLDPCAFPGHATAKTLVCRPHDGLGMDWFGRVWLNPPYGRDIGLWLDRLSEHGTGVALVFSRTDTKWFQRTVAAADWVFFFAGRIKFERPGTGPDTNAGHGNCLFGFGEKFRFDLRGTLLRGNL